MKEKEGGEEGEMSRGKRRSEGWMRGEGTERKRKEGRSEEKSVGK